MQMLRKPDGEALRRIREDQWISREELAQKAGLNPSTVYRIETGKETSPRMSTLQALAMALGVHPDKLVEPREGEGERKNPFNSGPTVRDISPGSGRYGVGSGGAWDLGRPELPYGEQAAFGNR